MDIPVNFTSMAGQKVTVKMISKGALRITTDDCGGCWYVPIKEFRDLLKLRGTPCLWCNLGRVLFFDFGNPSEPGLVCCKCFERHVVIGDQLTLLRYIFRPRS